MGTPELYVYRRAGAVVVDDDQVLLVSMQPPGQRRWWLFPGGGIEQGESPAEAAARELFEETGLRATAVRDYVHAGVHGGVHQYFAVTCDDLAIGPVTGPELDYAADADFRAEWVPIERLSSMPVFPRCIAEHLAEHGIGRGTDLDHVPWLEDDRGGWHGIPDEVQPPHHRTTARAVIVTDGRLAAIERVRGGERYFTLPGGGTDDDESAEDAVVRECKEELGLDVVAGAKLAVVEFRHDGLVSLQTFFWCDVTGGRFGTGHGEEYIDPSPRAGTYRPVWLPVDELEGMRPEWVADRLSSWIANPSPDRPERFVEAHDG